MRGCLSRSGPWSPPCWRRTSKPLARRLRSRHLAVPPRARGGRVEAGAPRGAPKILEIGAMPFMWQAFPGTTEFHSSWHDETVSAPEHGRHLVSLAKLPRLARGLADASFDVVVVHAPP